MDEKRINELTEVLRRLNVEGVTEELKEKATDIVANINPLELSIAEQKLVEEGMNPHDLRHLCDIHMEVLKDELNKLKTEVEPGDVLHTMIGEHDKILGFLKDLEEINFAIQKAENITKATIELDKLKITAANLLEAESHHKREEDVLFAELENRSITGPTRIMRMEHDDLRARKRRLKELAEGVLQAKENEFKENLDETSKYIVFNLRDHIFKENHILYPTALKSIQDRATWNKMKESCDKIGYCKF